MKEIRLNTNAVALVDNDDYERINKNQWYKDGRYACRWEYKNGKHTKIYMHREILPRNGKLIADHINNDGLDNRKDNLRLCTRQQNNCNVGNKGDKTSQYKGVCWDYKTNKWKATIFLNYKQIWLGRFNSEIEAANAYNLAATKYHGEFAYINEVKS